MRKVFLMAMLALAVAACKNEAKQQNNEEATEEQQVSEEATKTQCLTDFTDKLTLPQAGGEELDILSEVKNYRVSVIDFWASWCGPCRNEMPTMVELYRNNKDKGLCIFGISVDQDYDAWTTAMGELDITWPSVLDTDGDISTKFNVEYIPYTLVVDSKGTILATNLRGEELKKFVEEQLK